MSKISQNNSKEIIALSTFDAIRLRPTMYIGQISNTLEKIPVIQNGKLTNIEKSWSQGFMHLIVEILENSLDEAKRCKGKMKNISVKVNLDTNEVTVIDEGMGFHDAAKKHKKTKKNIVRTALEDIHAGSNFTDTSTNIIGTFGVGSAVVNILSQDFSVVTVNKTHYVQFGWKDYKVVYEEIRKKESRDKLGTSISFIPSPVTFPSYKWDEQLITTYLSFKSFLIKNDPVIKNLVLTGEFVKDGKTYPIQVSNEFIGNDFIRVDTPLGIIFLWEAYENSCSVSFVNGSQCTGIHQKVVNDWVNGYFKYTLAHHFYETLISLNVPSTLMNFADQNKTRYSVGRGDIETLMTDHFNKKLLKLLDKSEIARNIETRIDDRMHAENISKIRRAQKQSKRKISEKYSPPTERKESIYITEGLSAAGSVKQKRESKYEGVYALKGKIKNTRKLSDLSNNQEILEIMSILDIEPSNAKQSCYHRIIIAADEDADGQHISSLLINFFHKWFPQLIEAKKLFKIITPLVVCTLGKDRKYFYTMEEYHDFIKDNKVTSVNYLKGLGSLSLDDWEYVMQNKVLFQIMVDRSAVKYLDIAFGVSAAKRKKWLEKGG
jgi:DNA gyrase/topoisomerase IV subunit B